MKKHRSKWLMLSVSAAGLIVAVCVVWLLGARSGHRINPDAAMHLRLGMTQAQVEAIFKAPPGDYSTAARGEMATVPANRNPDHPDLRREDWMADEGGAAVWFGPDGRVADYTIWINVNSIQQLYKFPQVRKWWYSATMP